MQIDDYAKYTIEKIGEGHIAGGYKKLKEAYPNKIKELEEDLENNFTQDGLKEYRIRLVNGLKKIGHWDE